MDPQSVALFQNAAYLLVTGLVIATAYITISPMLEGDKLKKRMSSVADAREGLRQSRMDQLNQDAGLRKESKGLVRDLVDKLSLEKLLEASDLKDKLAQAGLRGQKPIYTFYFFRFALPIIGLLIGLVFFMGLNIMNWEFIQRVGGTIFAVAIGFYLPAIWVKNLAGKRMASIAPVFPDALDLLLICVESGMSVELAFAKVSEEMAENSVELAEEFSLTTAELSFLTSRRVAYENLARRNNHTGVRSVATSLIQAERYGTPLGDTLRTLANESRQMRVLAAEKKAAALPAKLTVPMILFFLPVLFIVVLTPAGMRMAAALG